MDIAIENHWLVENSVLYALLTDTLTSLKKQEEEFAKQGKLTKNKQKPHPKGMRYNPLVIKWSCMIASKCHKKGRRWSEAFFQFCPGKPSNNIGRRQVQQAQSPRII